MDVGIGKGNLYLGTRHFPDRKQASLVFEEGNVAIVIGTIRNEELWEQAVARLFKNEQEEK